MPRRLLAAAVLSVLLPHVAFARNAVIGQPEAAARTRPSRAAAIVYVFPEGAEISVSDEVVDGWRRVTLEDGSESWVEESALSFPEPAEAGADGGAGAAEAQLQPVVYRPDLRAPIYAKDVRGVADVVKDTAFSPRADALARRWRTSVAIWVAGGAAALALIGAGMAQGLAGSGGPGAPGFETELDQRGRLVAGGLAVAAGTGLVGLLIHPRRSELADLVGDWNAAHPDRMVEIPAGE